MSERSNRHRKTKGKFLTVGISILVVIVVIAGGFLFYQHQQTQKAFASDIKQARRLVLYNPLVKTGAAKQLQDALPGTGDKTNNAQLEKQIKQKWSRAKFESLIKSAKTQLASSNQTQLDKQNQLAQKTEKKLDGLKNQSSFPDQSKTDADTLTQLSQSYYQAKDSVGLNISVAGLQTLAGQTATLIQKKTAKANKLAEAAQDGNYPSLGALRGDLPYGAGVILIDELDNGPASKAGLQTVDDGGWDDSNVIVGINQYPVKSSVIGNDSMDNAMKEIELGSTATVKMKDGSTHSIKLNMSHNDVNLGSMQDFANPSGDADTDIDFGARGYSIRERNNDKEIGMVITGIEDDSSISDSDLKVGDVICRIDDETVGTEKSIDQITSDYSDGDTVTVDYVTKSGHLKTTDITLVGD
ncbi:PDZ domain-containing protein [Secundilactobacillus folii]|uniref:PDZ domain-containing protein n=1 Tax=Secundilactobacillus folii TaxID=2678357 RepID=A0A7X2XX48_9LACO|nr:PDZ domain-containing protein [Secundilactobacillus folii]MTV83208.1 PDZ domain-containing protein [Secundilactobacillus folii]